MYNHWSRASALLQYGLVAQLGERTVRIRKVEGSIPFESTKKKDTREGVFLFGLRGLRPRRPRGNLTCSAEMNPACAKVLLRKTLVTPHLRRIPLRSQRRGSKGGSWQPAGGMLPPPWLFRRKAIPFEATKKEVTFVYQKLLLFLSKPQAWHIITAQSAVHIISPFVAVYHHASACISLRLDDIPQQVADDIQCFALMICNGKPLICYVI